MATDDPIPTLLKQLNSSEKKVRLSAVEALGRLRDPRAFEPVLRLSRDKRWEVQSAAARTLGLMGDLRALDTLLQMYNGETYPLISSDGAYHQYDAILGGAAIGLGILYRQTGNAEIFEILTGRFRGEIGQLDQSKTPSTVQGLPYTGDRRVTPMLIQAAEASSYWLRYCGLEALGVLGDPAGLPILYSAVRLGDPLTYVWAAADALALIGNPDSDQPLLDGLRRLESEASLNDHLLWDEARAKIVRALGITGTSLARTVLEQRFSANDDEQRTLGAIGLAYMHDKRVFQPLIENLSVGDHWAQEAAALALGAFGDAAAIPALEERFHNLNVIARTEKAIGAALLQLRQ